MSRAIFMGLAAIVLFCVLTPVSAITWCHDYTLYRVTDTKENPDKTSVDDLRRYLLDHGYKKFPYTNAAENPKGQEYLKSGDVIIIGDAHSGTVREDGLIDHFIQREGSSGTAYSPEALPAPMLEGETDYKKGGLFLGDTLIGMRGRMTSTKSFSVEVWRKR